LNNLARSDLPLFYLQTLNGIQDTKQRALSLYASRPASRDKVAAEEELQPQL
jgi:hypothetical protein